MVEYKIELFIEETLTHMRRVQKVNWVNITDNPNGNIYKYHVDFNVTSINDKIVEGRVNL